MKLNTKFGEQLQIKEMKKLINETKQINDIEEKIKTLNGLKFYCEEDYLKDLEKEIDDLIVIYEKEKSELAKAGLLVEDLNKSKGDLEKEIKELKGKLTKTEEKLQITEKLAEDAKQLVLKYESLYLRKEAQYNTMIDAAVYLDVYNERKKFMKENILLTNKYSALYESYKVLNNRLKTKLQNKVIFETEEKEKKIQEQKEKKRLELKNEAFKKQKEIELQKKKRIEEISLKKEDEVIKYWDELVEIYPTALQIEGFKEQILNSSNLREAMIFFYQNKDKLEEDYNNRIKQITRPKFLEKSTSDDSNKKGWFDIPNKN